MSSSRGLLVQALSLVGLALIVSTTANRPRVATADQTWPPPVWPPVWSSDWIRGTLMRAHFHEAIALQDAVVRGDLQEAHAAATRLAQQVSPWDSKSGARTQVSALQNAARDVARAGSIPDAAARTGTALAMCGDCHLASGTRPATIVASSSALPGVVGHMLQHEQAVELMMRGLIVPSASDWEAGVRGLQEAPLRRRDLPPDARLTGRIAQAETRVHRLATDASAARDSQTRAKVYGQLLSTCAECHQLHHDVWGPTPR